MDNNLLKPLTKLICDNFPIPEDFEFTEHTKLASLGLDSLDIYEFVFVLEDEYDINIENAQNLETLGDLYDVTIGYDE